MRRPVSILVVVAFVSALALGAFAASPPHKQTGPGGGFADQRTFPIYVCKDLNEVPRGTVTATGPEKLWPPNHKFPPLPGNTVIARANDPNDQVVLNTNVDVVNVAGGDGGPNHDPDASPAEDGHTDPEGLVDPTGDQDPPSDPTLDPGGFDTGESAEPDGEGVSTTEHGLRAERSGREPDQGQRVYEIQWTASFTDTETQNDPAHAAMCSSEPDDEDGSGNGDISGPSPGYEPFFVCVPHDMRKENRGQECDGGTGTDPNS